MDIKKLIMRRLQTLLDLIKENEAKYEKELGVLFAEDQLLTMEVYRKISERLNNYTPEQLTQELRYLNTIYKRQLLIKECNGPEEAKKLFWKDIDELLKKGRRVEAIKRYRSLTGQGLKSSKEVVNKRKEELGI